MLSSERTPSLGDEMEPPPDAKVITSTALEALEDPELPLALKHREQRRLLRQRMFVGATVGGFICMLILATPVLVVTLSDPSARLGVVEHGTSTYDAGHARLVVQSATFSCQSVTAKPVASSEPVRSIMEKNVVYLDAFNPASHRWDSPPPPPVTVLQASPGVRDGSARAVKAGSGLVSTLLDAYAQHHELLLRPDDVWQAIITQLNFYVNGGRAERLRDVFVDFDGQRELKIETCCSMEELDYGALAREFTDLIAANVNDPTLVDWTVPSFSTSTHTDRVVASVTLMSTLRAYFQYTISLTCGFPKVTLLGTPADWALLRTKIDRLLEFELEEGLMARWHALLAPVLDEMVRTSAGEPADVDWWAGVAQEETVNAGCTTKTYFDGWVTALVPFDARGQWNLGMCYHEGARVPLPAPECPGQQPRIERGSLPVAAVSVNVTIETASGASIFTSMIAGQFAQDVSANGVGLQPRSDWLIGYT